MFLRCAAALAILCSPVAAQTPMEMILQGDRSALSEHSVGRQIQEETPAPSMSAAEIDALYGKVVRDPPVIGSFTSGGSASPSWDVAPSSDPIVRSGGGKTCYTGPRGGTYTITSGGNKNYSGC